MASVRAQRFRERIRIRALVCAYDLIREARLQTVNIGIVLVAATAGVSYEYGGLKSARPQFCDELPETPLVLLRIGSQAYIGLALLPKNCIGRNSRGN